MMVAIAALLGAIYGGFRAHRRGGKKTDIAQYAAVFAIVFAILALFANVALVRLM